MLKKQEPDDLPQLFSSQQIKIINKGGNSEKEPENDDSSIFRKIYNEDT